VNTIKKFGYKISLQLLQLTGIGHYHSCSITKFWLPYLWYYRNNFSHSYTVIITVSFFASCDKPTDQGLHYRMVPVIPGCSRRDKLVSFASGVYLQRLIGELGTP